MSDREKLYAERDYDEIEPYRMKHIMAMTAEGLHSKSDIADELAYRDKVIADQTEQLTISRQHIAELEHQIKEIEENLDIEREEVRSLESAIASHKDRGLKHRQQIAELEKDCDIISGEYLALRIKHFDLQEYAAIGKFLIENATEWRRSHDGTGYAIMGLRLPYDADLSSVGMRRYSVEQVMKAAKGAAE